MRNAVERSHFILYFTHMSTMKKAFALLGVVTVLLPSFAFAATGKRVYEGNGTVSGKGFGMVSFVGNGQIKVEGSGTLVVNKSANVKIKGTGERAVTGDVVTYTGFNGTAEVRGKDVKGSLSGDVKNFKASGKGTLTLEGDGKVSARKGVLLLPGKSVEKSK